MKKIHALIALISISLCIWAFPYLPESVPMHWNIKGEVDNYMAKPSAAIFFPVIIVAMILLFRIIPKLDPRKEKYKLFEHEWNIIQSGLLGFFLYIQAVVFYISINPTTPMMPAMFVGLGLLFILLGNYLSKIRQNYFIGIKLPWTMADEDNWNKTHRYASKIFVAAGILAVVQAVIPFLPPSAIFIAIISAAILPTIYSFLLYKNAQNQMKYVYIIAVIVVALLGVVRLLSDEDGWVCSKGSWIKHGSPTNPAPTSECIPKE